MVMKKIALGQMNIEYGNFEKNLRVAESLIQSAAQANADVLLLPELWSSGFDLRNRSGYIQPNHALLDQMQSLVNQQNMIVGGTYIIKENEHFYNSFIALQPNLPRVHYNKHHLFRLMKEDQYFSTGQPIAPIPTRCGSTALAVCFDLRFPEFFRSLRSQGAETFLISAHWPLARINHWEILLQARAIENQAYVIAVNSTGRSGKDEYGGTSMIVSPTGEILMKAPSSEAGLFIDKIDAHLVSIIREEFPIA
jgi:predicted amidohydrolase